MRASNLAYELMERHWWPTILKLRSLGNKVVRIEKTYEGYILLVGYKCGITDYLTVRERELLDE